MATDRVFISETDSYLFGRGTHYEIYRKLGAHPSEENGVKGMHFGVWAPNAQAVFVIGSFENWDEYRYPMNADPTGEGLWSLFIPEIGEGELYKYLIISRYGEKLYKADPFANYAEMRPGNASVTADISGFDWNDAAWIKARAEKDPNREPLAIYECHIGSYMKHPRGENGFYNYREFADVIVDHLKELPFNAVELIGVLEHPFDGSWGYQVTGYYAPTSRYGTPKDFMYLVNKLHENGIAVILDWVPAHFCPDAHGLARFDGDCIFEDPDPRRGQHPEWGTRIFNLGRNEVSNFLIANVFYWIREFHIDGIRVDAVASMLYLNYARKDGEWIPNIYGGNENLEAVGFFKHLNSLLRKEFPGVLSIAEESTAWPRITGDVEEDGLGFSFKWNMGWMHDFLEYMELDPVYRSYSHYNLTFAMSYNSSENYILPLSHDEVVHLKRSMIGKMPGYQNDKFANLRIGYAYFMGHAGKKLLFMGQEFGQEREWSEARELDWYQLQTKESSGLMHYVADLLKIYRSYPCMYEIDNDWAGFQWVNADDKEQSIYSFYRRCKSTDKKLLFVINMTPVTRYDYKVGVPAMGDYKVVLCSARKEYGAFDDDGPTGSLVAKEGKCDKLDQHIEFHLPGYTAVVFEFEADDAEPETEAETTEE